MTTVIDPGGTPVPVYNRSGTTIVQLAGDHPSTPTVIPAISGWTVVITITGAGGDSYRLPAGAEIGDIVELHAADANAQDLFAPSGETIRGQSSIGLSSMGGSGLFRKFSATQWA